MIYDKNKSEGGAQLKIGSLEMWWPIDVEPHFWQIITTRHLLGWEVLLCPQPAWTFLKGSWYLSHQLITCCPRIGSLEGTTCKNPEHPWALLFRVSNSVWRFFMNSTKKRWGLAASVANMSSKALLDFTWVGEGAIEPPFGISSRGESTLFIPFLGPNFAWTWVDWCICKQCWCWWCCCWWWRWRYGDDEISPWCSWPTFVMVDVQF